VTVKSKGRLLKHFSLHRIANTELRVVSDVESGVIPFIEVEEEVIGKYARNPQWQQGIVTLFILKDLQPLLKHLSRAEALPPGGLAGLEYRPIVNVYDLKNPRACHVFINQKAMEKEGYWGDREAVKGLLAHEHAHPLAECETTRSSRKLRVDLSPSLRAEASPLRALARRALKAEGIEARFEEAKGWQDRINGLLRVLVEKLCLYAPREIFANDVAIQSDFTASLFYLDKKEMFKAGEGVRSRGILERKLQEEVPSAASLLLTFGDMKGYLDLALETASFYRQGKRAEAKELEEMLFVKVMPHLEPGVAETYEGLRDGYLRFSTQASPQELAEFERSLLDILAEPLQERGLELGYRLRVVPG